jgi:Uma2 family endonuclease
MSPKRFHSAVQKTLLILLNEWSQEKGEVYPEWAIILKRKGEDWVPVPDLTYVSYQRLPPEEMEDEACPVPPDLVIEIISPGQTFGQLAEKATDYLEAGVLRVWVVDPQARSITVFYPDAPPRTYTKAALLTDSLLEGLQLTSQQVFGEAKLPNSGKK